MIFKYPLLRQGFYYMSHQTFDEINSDEKDKETFHKIISACNAKIKKLKKHYLITI